MRPTSASLAILFAVVSLLTACSDDGSGEDTATDAAEAPGDTQPADAATDPADAAGDEDEPDTPDADAASTDAVRAGSGTARVEVADEVFDFRVIQCLRDVPGLLGGTVAFQLDGVPGDTPPELVEPLVGVADPDSDIFELLGPVLEYGPVLSVIRMEDGGDYIAVSLGGGEAYVSDDISSGDQPLTIGDEAVGASVAGETTVAAPNGGSVPVSLEATCP